MNDQARLVSPGPLGYQRAVSRGALDGMCGVLKAAGLCSGIACEPMVVEAFETPEPVVMCPSDSVKAEPGVCGCDVPDDDFDGDGAMDCVEDCPDNAARTSPMGACGCSALDATATCTELREALRNLYTFDGTGDTLIDSVSATNGTLSHTVSETPLADLAEASDQWQAELRWPGQLRRSAGRHDLDPQQRHVRGLADMVRGRLLDAHLRLWQ